MFKWIIMSNQCCMCDTLLSVQYRERWSHTPSTSRVFQSEIVINPCNDFHEVEIYTLWALVPWIVFVRGFTFTPENFLKFIIWIASILLSLVYMLTWWVGSFDTLYMTYSYSGMCYIEANLRISSFSVILSVIVHKLISKSGLNLEFVLSLGEKNSMAYVRLKRKKKKKNPIWYEGVEKNEKGVEVYT